MASATTSTAMSREASGPRAGFWRRFAAVVIDGVILSIIGIFVGAAFKGGAGRGVSAAVSLLYATLFIGGRRGQTPGMAALGIRVISLDDSGPIGYGRALIRWLGAVVSAIPLFLGYFWMLWDKENQCWHDKFARDVVVPVSDYPSRR
jgi:uncharacterized RDD family membrane protein YckC